VGTLHYGMGETDTNEPWPDWADATHLSGDVYFIDKYGGGWWMAAAMISIGLFPLGPIMPIYMAMRCLKRPDDDIELYKN